MFEFLTDPKNLMIVLITMTSIAFVLISYFRIEK
jgi:hypothetical protein